jgi:hypothetical protein
MRAWWVQQRFGFSTGFKQYIDNIVAEMVRKRGAG